ncbi:MAG: type I restriction enzyme S subunit [Polaribacter sp.]|jgi:type I restriction enzyme S subunit
MILNDLCEFIIDCEHKTAPIQEIGYPSIRTPNIGKGNLILDGVNRVSEEVYLEWSKRGKPEPGDLIIAREAPVGNIAIIPDGLKVCLGQRTVLVRPNNDKVDSRYLCYYLLGNEAQGQILTKTSGATVAHLNMKDIRGLKISNLPNISLQKQIASILSAYDDLIENNNQRIKLLENMAEEIYKEWFVRFRFPGYKEAAFLDKEGIQGTHGIKGAIPEGWAKVRLDKYIDFEKGVEPGSANYESECLDENYVSFLRVGDLGSRYSNIFIKKELSKGKYVTKDDIIITLDGTVGKVAMGFEGCYSSGLRKIVYKTDLIKRSFIYLTLLSANIQGTIQSHAAGTTILHASSSIKFMKILMPKENLLQNFENLVNPMLDEILLLKDKNQILQETRNLLLPRLISGKLSVEGFEVE